MSSNKLFTDLIKISIGTADGNFGHYDKRIKHLENENNVSLVVKWLIHSLRLFKHYSMDVLWNPTGIVWQSLRGRKYMKCK